MFKGDSNYPAITKEKMERIRGAFIPEREVLRMTENFRALSDPTRLRILSALENWELCVCDIAGLIGLPQPSVSHHLKALRQLGLVEYKKSGKRTIYSIRDKRIMGLLAVARDLARNNV